MVKDRDVKVLNTSWSHVYILVENTHTCDIRYELTSYELTQLTSLRDYEITSLRAQFRATSDLECVEYMAPSWEVSDTF
jgi:hypothetical protein